MILILDTSKLLHVTTRRDWRAWLKKHYRSETDIWLVYCKKHTGRPTMEYNDSVEEALCFGWIDSTVKTIDQDRYARRFTPRRPRSHYSQANRERLKAMIQKGKVVEEVLSTAGEILNSDTFAIPPDILKALRANKQAWKHFQGYSSAYIRIRVAFIAAARNRPREFEKRLRYFIRMTEKNRQFGYGGIEKHY